MALAKRSKLWIWSMVGVVLLGLAFVGTALATDRSGFCRTCHEMRPYNDAWEAGTHADAWCIDCHVEPGLPARFAHKFVALGEVKAHLLGDTKFPRATPPDVPAERCVRCHTKLPAKTESGFPHAVHAKKGPCTACHATVGHKVSADALKAVGAYAGDVKPVVPAITGATFAAINAGKANLTGHVKVSCTRCHDMSKTGCARCHTPKHKPRGACLNCHKPGPKFVFLHPSGSDCAGCHKVSAKHFKPTSGTLPACTTCHRKGGVSWAFSHPGSGSDCRSCHTPPASHPAGQCSACHRRTGVSFAFSHPSAGEHSWRSKPCAACHPKSLSAVSCTCHGGRTPSGD